MSGEPLLEIDFGLRAARLEILRVIPHRLHRRAHAGERDVHHAVAHRGKVLEARLRLAPFEIRGIIEIERHIRKFAPHLLRKFFRLLEVRRWKFRPHHVGADHASVGAMIMKSLSRRASSAAFSFPVASSSGTTTLPATCPQRLGATWSSMWIAAMPAASKSWTVRITLMALP